MGPPKLTSLVEFVRPPISILVPYMLSENLPFPLGPLNGVEPALAVLLITFCQLILLGGEVKRFGHLALGPCGQLPVFWVVRIGHDAQKALESADAAHILRRRVAFSVKQLRRRDFAVANSLDNFDLVFPPVPVVV